MQPWRIFSRQEYWSGVPLPSPKAEPESLNTECHVCALLLLLLSHFSRVQLCATP